MALALELQVFLGAQGRGQGGGRAEWVVEAAQEPGDGQESDLSVTRTPLRPPSG